MKRKNAEKIEYLERYKEERENEKNILRMLEDVSGEISPKAIRYSDMPKGTATPRDLSDYVVKYESLLEKLQRERIKKANVQIEITNVIMELKKGQDETDRQLAQDKTLLYLRYIRDMKWEEIMDEMGYSWKQIHRIHGRALQNVEIMT